MNTELSRRRLIFSAAATAAASWTAPEPASDESAPKTFDFCLNTSTIRGQGLVEEIEIAAKAGYQGIEPWVREIDEYVQKGGSLDDLRKRIADLGLSVESAVGFPQWIVDDDERRAKGLEEAKRNMDLVQRIGGKRLAAPPVGATDQTDVNLLAVADRYRVLLELGDQMGVVPQLELWGFSKALSRLGECAMVAIERRHPRACLLLDVYHLYKGGSEFTGLRLVRGAALHVIHMNDYPATPPRSEITDAHRVYPGDGVAPLEFILGDLWDIGFRGMLSLELFNRDYWIQDALTVAKTGIEKMRGAVSRAVETAP
jgi:sugar phosphate isomerase/epimerase